MWGYPGSLQFRAIFLLRWNENARTIQKQQTNRSRTIWLFYRTDTNCVWLLGRLSDARVKKPENFQETNRYFAWTSYCNTIGQSNNTFSILGFSLAGKAKSPCFDLFIHWLIKQITNTYRNHFSRSYENRSNHHLQKSSGKSCRKVNGTWLFVSIQRNVWKGSPVFPEGLFQTRVFTLSTISHSRFCSAMNDPSSLQTDIRMWKK